MIVSLLIMVSALFSEDQAYTSSLELIIKTFLNSVHHFEYETRDILSVSKPIWLSKGNFLSLLNLPRQIKRYGNIRLYWDGNKERCIQYVKPYLSKTQHTATFYEKKLQRVYKLQTIDLLLNNFIKTNKHDQTFATNYEHMKVYERYNSNERYKTIDIVKKKIENLQPISCMIFYDINSDIFRTYVCVKEQSGKKDVHLYKIQFNDDIGEHINGHWKCPISINNNPGNSSTMSNNSINNESYDFGLLIPYIYDKEVGEGMYSCITKQWKTRNKNNRYRFPRLLKKLFHLFLCEHTNKI